MTDKEAFEIGLRLGACQRIIDIAMRTLQEIANEDFRGNRSTGAIKAFHTLIEIDRINQSTIIFDPTAK